MHIRTRIRCAICFSGYVLFICIGASIILAMEEDEEIELKEDLQKLKQEFLQKHPCVHDDELRSIIHAFLKGSKKGIHALDNVSHWNFAQGLYFATSIVTTIGYGHKAPLTQSGKIFTILFALAGIPLTLSVLSTLVDRLIIPTTALLQWFNSKLESSYRPIVIRLLHLAVVLSIFIIFFLLLPAISYHYLEPDWNFSDSVYSCFISLTTIGFGDFTPGDSITFLKKSQLYQFTYKLCTIIYLFAGITYMMLTLAIFYDIPQLNLRSLYTTQSVQFPDPPDELEIHGETSDGIKETRKTQQVKMMIEK